MINQAFRPNNNALQGLLGVDPTATYNAQLDTAQNIGQYDPMLGSQWGQFLDASGASDPGGTKMKGGGLPPAPPNIPPPVSPTPGLDAVQGLANAGPSAQDKRARLAMVQNMSQPAANQNPGATTAPYQPFRNPTQPVSAVSNQTGSQ
jgi:hypothetical protein